jgi:hypothetical protein
MQISSVAVRKVKVWQKSCLSTGESPANQGKSRKKTHSVVIGHPPIGLGKFVSSQVVFVTHQCPPEAHMSDTQIQQPPKAHARIVFLGAVSPHWEVYGEWGDQNAIDEFRSRVLARLVLLPRDDPQFRRNMARIVRDAERELISLEWDMGDPNYEF